MRKAVFTLLGISLIAALAVVDKIYLPKSCSTNIEQQILLGHARDEDPDSYWDCQDGINVLIQPNLR